jgi:serine/threonine protein kinase
MDYIEGQDLLELAIEAEASHELLPVDQVTQWMLQVCDAVAYLHAQTPSIVHRDIKPNNIRLSKSGQAILVDFGIAKVDPSAKTEMMAKAVSEGYSPPEQYAGSGGTDTRSDVYALGATLYCLLTVKPPPDSFQRLTRGARLVLPRRINKDVDKALQDVVMTAMSLAASQRYQDAGEMLDALYRAVGQDAGRKPVKHQRRAAQSRNDKVTGEICARCGTRVRPGARFCRACGERLAPTQVQPRREARRRCGRCGAENRAGAHFCARCRARLTS